MLGIPLAPLAAVWAMLTDLIPQVGGFLGGSFLVLLAVTQGVTPAIIAGVAFVLYMNLENHVIQPAIVGRSVDLTPPTTMVAAFVGGAIAGDPRRARGDAVRRRGEGDLPRGPRQGQGRRRAEAAASSPACGRSDGVRRDEPQWAPRRVVATLRDPSAQIAQSVEQRTRNA